MQFINKIRVVQRLVNPKSELFASTFSFGVTAFIRLCSSLVLTRLLTPKAYGIFGILLSLVFIVELLSDVGITALIVRHPRGGETRFIHTIWTIRLLRSWMNFSVLFLAAPLIADLYNEPVLTSALRLFSFQYLISGLETMSFSLAQRDRKARISNYADMISSAIMTVFVIVAASVLRSYLALIYGVLLQRALIAIGSYFFYRQIGVGFKFDREAVVEQLKFARFILPSSVLTIVLSQYDKLALLKLFNLSLVGIYSIAGNMIAPITGIIVHNSRVILYARCAEYFRVDRATARFHYYSENRRLLTVGVMLPAIVAGCSQLIVTVLYDARYAMVGPILMIVALGAVISASQNASENVLVASGRTQIYLVANILRVLIVVPSTFLGYYLFGFYGFLWFGFISSFALVIFYFYQQYNIGLLSLRVEFRRFGAALLVFALCYAITHLLLVFIPTNWLHLVLGKHPVA